MRKVKESGYVSIRKQGYFLSEAFGGKTIAVKKSSKGHHLINIYFRQFKIGQIDKVTSLNYIILQSGNFSVSCTICSLSILALQLT